MKAKKILSALLALALVLTLLPVNVLAAEAEEPNTTDQLEIPGNWIDEDGLEHVTFTTAGPDVESGFSTFSFTRPSGDYPTDSGIGYLESQLTGDALTVYNALEEALFDSNGVKSEVIKQFEDAAKSGSTSVTFSLSTGVTLDTVDQLDVLTTLDRDHSELFWIKGGAVSANGTTVELNIAPSWQPKNATTNPEGGRIISTDYNTLTAGISSLFTEANGKASDFEKLRCVHDWLVNNNQYGDANETGVNLSYQWEAVSAFDEELSPVCEGYARAFKLVCDKLGIPCVLVSGYTKAGNKGAHMWNYVQLSNADGSKGWYMVDVTWDDPVTTDGTPILRYDYFLIGQTTLDQLDSKGNYEREIKTTYLTSENGTTNSVYSHPTLSTDDYSEENGPAKIVVSVTTGGTASSDKMQLSNSGSTEKFEADVYSVPTVDKPNGKKSETILLQAKVLDAAGQELSGRNVIWSIPNYANTNIKGYISIQDTGNNTAEVSIAEGLYNNGGSSGITSFNVIASYPTVEQGTQTIYVQRNASSATFYEVDGPDTLTAGGDPGTYTVKAYDQYGFEMADSVSNVTWSASPTEGVTVENGVVTVANTVSAGKITLTATVGGKTAEKEITVTPAGSVTTTVNWPDMASLTAVYGTPNDQLLPTLTGTATITESGTSQTVNGRVVVADPSGALLNAGTQSLTVNFVADGTGEVLGTTTAAIEITKRPITLKVKDIEAAYSPTPSYSYELEVTSGELAGGDTLDSLVAGLKVTYSISNPENKPVGDFTISAAVGTPSSNYDVTIDSGTLKVNPLTATIPESLGSNSVKASAVTAENTYASLSLPEKATVTYSDGTTGELTITGWNMTEAELYAAASSGSGTHELTASLAPLPAWAVFQNMVSPKFTLSITDKDPAEVTVTVEDTTYDGTAAAPSATATANGTEISGAKFTFHYSGTKLSGESYVSNDAPADAGTYTVTATLDHETYGGSSKATFTIAPKPVTLTWTDPESLVYNNTEKAVTAAVSDENCKLILTGDKATNAGTYTAKAELSSKNYTVTDPAALEHQYIITKAAQTLSVGDETLILLPGALSAQITYQLTPAVEGDPTGKVSFTLKSGSSVSLNTSDGKVTGTQNGGSVVTVTAAATENYDEAAQDVTVKVIAAPVLGVESVTGGGEGSTLTAELGENKVVVTGLGDKDAEIAVTLSLCSDELTQAQADGKIVVKYGETVVAEYTIDASAVTAKDAQVDIEEGSSTPTVEDGVPDENKANVEAALKSPLTTVSGLLASASEKLQAAAKKLLGESEKATVTVTVEIKATGAKTNEFLTLDITPKYTITVTRDGETTTAGSGNITDSSLLTSPVKLTVKLPDGLFDSADENSRFFVLHTHGGKTETIRAEYDHPNKTVSWEQSTFSVDQIVLDNRSASITFTGKDGMSQTKVYDRADIGTALPSSGSGTSGWIYTDGDTENGPYTSLTEDLLNALQGKTVSMTPKESGTGGTGTGGTGTGGTGTGGTGTGGTGTGGTGTGGTGAGSWWYPGTTYVPSTTRYPVSAGTAQNGSVSLSSSSAKPGDTVTVTVRPNTGYELGSLTVTGKNGSAVGLTNQGGGSYTFTMPTSAVNVSASFTPIVPAGLPFYDVDPNSWYYDAVKYVYDNSLMNGTGYSSFEPYTPCYRNMMVTILYRMDKEPSVYGAPAFNDVPSAGWYTNAVIWGSANRIVEGGPNNRFMPMGQVTREQIAVFLYRYAQYKNCDVSAWGDLSAFADGGRVSDWAKAATTWAVGAGLLNGSANRLNPGTPATRAEIAMILQRFCENVLK